MELKQINETEVRNHKLLGIAFGASLMHCVHEGAAHCRNFEKRVKYYYVVYEIFSKKNKILTGTKRMTLIKFFE